MNSSQLYFRLLSYFKPYRSIVVLTLVLMAVSGGVEAVLIRLLKYLIDGFADMAAGTVELWLMPSVLFGVGMLRMIASYGYEYSGVWLSSRITHDVRREMFDRLLKMPSSTYDKSSVGELLSRVTYDVNGIMDAGLQVVGVLVRDGVLVLGLLVVLFWTDWRLALFCALLIPGVGLSMRLVAKRQRRLSMETQDSMGILARILNETLSSHKVVKMFSGWGYETGRFGTVNQRVRRLAVKRAGTTALNSGLNLFLVAVVIALIVYYAGVRAQEGAITAGAFVSFMGAMLMLQQPIKNLTRVNDQLSRGLAAAQSVFALIDQAVEADHGETRMARAQGALSIRNLSFRYLDDQPPALSNVSLEIQPGETVAFVGHSGSGKTTLFNLIARFYDNYEGEIVLDGHPVQTLLLSDYRKQIAWVSQDVTLFNDTVIANIAYAETAPDFHKVEQAAQMAYASGFIEALPKKYEEMLGEDGTRLSGGQRQRLAIARALYRDAPILMLDEATSALDTESERMVQAAVENLMSHRTTLVIAHRLSTIENADRIVVMQGGRVVEVGNHATLLAKGGLYAAMHAAQFQEPV